MPEKPHAFTGDAARLIAEAVRQVLRQSREGYNLTPTASVGPPVHAGAVVWFARVTGPAVGGSVNLSSLYPGSLILPDDNPDRLSDPDPDQVVPWREEPCWVRALPNEELQIGDSGVARFVGWREAFDIYPMMAVYAFACCAGSTSGPPPAAPTSLTATPGDQETFLVWTEPTGAPPAETYFVYYSTASNMADATFFVQTSSTSATVTGLDNGTTYFFAVTAVHNSAQSAYSNVDDATPSPPGAPTSLTATPGDTEVFLTWTQPAGNPPAATYLVYYSTNADMSGSTFFVQTPGTSATVTGLDNGTTYYFQVVAQGNNGGQSPTGSNIDSAEPFAPPSCGDVPENLPFTTSTGEIGSGTLVRTAACDGSGAEWTYSSGATACSPAGGVDISISVDGSGDWTFAVQDDGDSYTGDLIFDSASPFEARIVYTAGASSCGGPGVVTITVTD